MSTIPAVDPAGVRPTSGAGLALALLVIAAATVAVAIIGSQSDWIVCWKDCGEVFDALLYVDNFRLYGFRFGLLQDMATSPRLEAHPFLYTHNVNIGGLVFVGLDALGIGPIGAKQAFNLAPFALGLLYIFLAIRLHSGSAVIAIVGLVLYAIDVSQVLSFALNPLRTWHWLVLFGLLFHLGKAASGPGGRCLPHWAAVALLAIVSLGVGYDFWVICLAACAALLIAYRWVNRGQLARALALLLILFAIPVAARQLQVIAVLGVGYWWQDFAYSAMVKIPYVSALTPAAPATEVAAFYREHNVLRPPAEPPGTLRQMVFTFLTMTKEIALPSYGLVGLLLVSLSGLAACGIIVHARSALARRRPEARPVSWLGSAILVFSLCVGVVAGLVVFAPFSLHVYLKHGFPLLAGPVLVCKAIVIGSLLEYAFRAPHASTTKAVGAVSAASLIALDALIVNVRNAVALETMSVGWISAVRQRSDSTFAVSWIPNSVSVFTDQWAIGIRPGRERQVLERLATGRDAFQPGDLLLFGERDGMPSGGRYLTPDYWLYFPTQQILPFDHPTPTCRSDWLMELARARRQAKPVNALVESWLEHRGDDGRVTLGLSGILSGGTQAVERLAAVPMRLGVGSSDQARGQAGAEDAGSSAIIDLRYNCIYRRFQRKIALPGDRGDVPFGFELIATRKDGSTTRAGVFEASATHGPPPIPWSEAGEPQPTVSEILAAYPNLPIAAMGDDFLLIDLRPLRQQPNVR